MANISRLCMCYSKERHYVVLVSCISDAQTQSSQRINDTRTQSKSYNITHRRHFLGQVEDHMAAAFSNKEAKH